MHDENSHQSKSNGHRACDPAQLSEIDEAKPNEIDVAKPNKIGKAKPSEIGEVKPKWEKVLWKKQPYPDNHTDATFLQELVIDTHVPQRCYWQVVLSSAVICQQMSTVVASVAVPMQLRIGLLSGTHVLLACVLLLVTGNLYLL
eukprot:gene5011-34795_t